MKNETQKHKKESLKRQLPYLGEFEELILLAVYKLGDNAYGVTIRQLIEEITERNTSIGAIYTTLDRLERKGFVSSSKGEPTPERGGRAKRYFRIEGDGIEVLRQTHTMRNRMLSGSLSLEPL